MPGPTWTSDPSGDTRGATDRNERCSWRLWKWGTGENRLTSLRAKQLKAHFGMLFLLFLPLLDSRWRVELIAMYQGTGEQSVVAPLPFVSCPWRDYRMSEIHSERGGFCGNASILGSGVAQFEFWPGHRLSRPRLFVVSLSRSWQMVGEYHKPGHHSFLPHPCQFIIHCYPSIRCWVVWVAESATK